MVKEGPLCPWGYSGLGEGYMSMKGVPELHRLSWAVAQEGHVRGSSGAALAAGGQWQIPLGFEIGPGWGRFLGLQGTHGVARDTQGCWAL